MARTLSEQNIKRFNPTNIEDITPVLVNRKFGRPEDYIDIYITDLNDQILDYIPNFSNYTVPQNNPYGALTNEFDLDPKSILEDRGYQTGTYRLYINIQKRKIFNDTTPPFRIKSISTDRTELKLYSIYSNTLLRNNSRKFINDIQTSPYFRDFTLTLGENINLLGVNADIDTSDSSQYLLLIKLFKPLPENLSEGTPISIVEDITDPLILTYDLGVPPPIDTSTSLKGPNFKIDTRINGSVPTAFKSYDNILKTSTTSSYQKLLSKLDGYEIPEIDYSYVRPVPTASIDFLSVTPSHFENFVHFGSATERLKNFEYKLKLIEVYNKQLEEIRTITGTTANSSVVLNSTSSIELKKENLIQGLDGYEQFLYFESGAYSWPKSTPTEPYLLEPTTSPISQTWLGSGDSFNSYYGGQLLSASTFDSQNPNRLFKLTPTFIGDDPKNQPFETFCDMVGTHFDPIWAHIKEITQIRDNSHKYGVSKDLVYYALQSLGIKAYDQFENEDLIDYVFGKTFTTTDTATVITASNEIFSKQDISKEVWKRLYHNAPYLLKTKGTERGLRALINCYGIPDTILDIKEYGSSHPDRDEFKLYTYSKFTKAIDGHSRDAEGFFIETNWSSSFTKALSASAKTVEFRINPNKINKNQHLFTLSGSISSSDLHLILEEYGEGENMINGGNFGQLPISHNWLSLSSPTTSERSTEQSYTDGFSYKTVTNASNQGIYNAPNNQLNVVSGSTYEISYWYYPVTNSNPGNGKYTQVSLNSNTCIFNDGLSYQGENVPNYDQWNNVKRHFKALQTGTSFLSISMGIGAGPHTSYIDNITLREVTSDHETKDFYEVGDNVKFARLNLNQFTSSIATTDYFPVFNNEFWQIFIGTDGASGSDATVKFGAYQANHLREVDFFTSSIAISERQNSEVWGNRFYNGLRPDGSINPKNHTGADICYFGGVRNIFNSTAVIAANAFTSSNYFATTPTTEYTGSAFDLNFSGSLSEVRIYKGELLSHNTLKKHALEPLMYAGNTVTSSYDGLVLRLPLSFELELTTNTNSQLPSGSIPMLNGGLGGVGGSGATGTAWNQSPNNTGLISPPSPLTGPITGGAILDSSGNPVTVGANYSGQYFGSGSVPTYAGGAPIFSVSGIPLLRSHHPNEKIDYLDGFTFFENDSIILLEEEHHLPTPNTIGKSPINKKIRIDSGSTDDDILSPDILSQLPTPLRQVPDFDAISVFLSPQNEINEDIIYTLGTFSLDEFLGDPRDQTSNSYPQIEILKNHYFRKLEKGSQKQNIFDFTRWVQFIDHTLFDLIKQFVPQKSTTKTGLLIEPHYLERSKFQRFHPSQSNHVYDSTIQDITASFHKNSNFSQLNNTTGSAVITQYNFIGTGSDGRELQSGYNFAITPTNYFTGSSAWEQGPIVPNSTGSAISGSDASYGRPIGVKQRNSSGSNELRPALTPYGNFINSLVSRKRFKSDKAVSSSGNVEFDDSLIDMASWKLPRYEGSKLTGAKINEYTVGDISYGLNPVINQNVSALFYGQSIIGADGEDDSLTTIKNHSYLDIEKIILINKYSDKITTIDLKNEKYKGTNGYISNAFKDGSSFNIHLVDDKITHKLKDTYKAKFSQGYLYKILEHKGHDGSGNISGEGIQVGYVDDSPAGFPYATSTSQNVLCYGKDSATINSSTVELKENTLTKKIWPQNQTFGRVDFLTSSLNNHYYSSWDNLGMFVNSMLIPVASESKHRLFGTFNLGQPLQVADYTTGSNQGIKSISTAEFDLEAYVTAGSLHDQISGSGNMSGFGRALIRPDHLVIPIMQGHHDIITDKKEGANITWPAPGGDTGGSHNGATDIELTYYFSGDANIGSAIYQISYLEETNVIIANLDKPTELANDLGDKGFILIPDNLDKDIKVNLDFFLNKAGYKEGSPPERIANRKE